MDYDDNDILHHNPQLAGEGRSKSSSVLRPYDFPKFDFDDSLQGHLKFDTLVETEVFLGIQSQEDNQWIEDFSRGSNGMEFNSTPADSCSISRRNNIWSEATSPESVEMLLKSVGQEEMMTGNTIIQDPNTCNDQGAKPVKFRSTLDGNTDGMTGNLEATLPLEESVENHPHLEGPVEEQLHDAKEPSQAASRVESACLSSDDLVDHVANGKGWTTANEGTNTYGGECSNEDLKELSLSDVKSMKCGAEEDSLCSAKTVDDVNSNFVVLNDPFDGRNNDRQEKHISSGREEESKVLEGKRDEAGVHTCRMSSSSLVDKLGVINRDDAGQGNLNNVIEIPDKSTGGKSEMRSSQEEGRSRSFATSLQTEKQVEILPSTIKMNYPFEDCQDGSVVVVDQLSTHLGTGNPPDCASPQEKVSTAVQLAYTGNSDQMKGVPGTPLKNERISSIPLSSIEDNKVAKNKLDCTADANANDSSDMAVLSTAAERKQTNNVEGCHTDTRGILEESAVPLPTCVIDSTKLEGEENSDHTLADSAKTKQHMHPTKAQDEILSVEPGNANADHIRMLKEGQSSQSLDISKDVKANVMARHEESVGPMAPNDLTQCEQRELAVMWLPYSDNDTKESASRIKPDRAFRTETDSVSKFGVSVTDDANRTSLAEISAVSPHSMEKSNEDRSSESPAVAANKCLDSNQSQVDLGHHRSLTDSGNSELVCEKNHELMKKTEGEKEPVQTSEVDKASCGSPTIISSSEPCPMEKDNQEQARGSQVINKSVDDIQPSSEDPKTDYTVGDDTSFTFKVTALPETTQRESGKCWSPVPIAKKCNSSVANEEGIPSGEDKTARTSSRKTPRKNARVSDGERVSETSQGTSDCRGRRSSAKGTAKEKAEGNQAKRTSLDILSGKGDKASDTLVSTSSISNQHVQLGQMLPCGQIERGNAKVSSAVAIPTSNLPDLNTSALSNSSCPPALFRQPFTDSQQVQLRAQIFVYGSLIQGTAPDEACMVSAFGPSDGGRTIWEPVWHAAIERLQNQKSNLSGAETPLHSQSGPQLTDAAVKQSPHASKLLPSLVNRSSTEGTSAPVVNPIIPLSSPLWSLSTPLGGTWPSTGVRKGPVADYQHAATSMHSYQTPPTRNFVGQTSWPSSTCFYGPRIASPQTSTFNSTGCFQAVTMTETVKLTSVNETSGPLVPGMKHVTSSPAAQNVGPSPAYVGISPVPDLKMASSAQKHSADAKPRKRKKVASSDPSLVSVVSEARTEPVVTNAAGVLSSPVAALAFAGPSSDAVPGKAAGDASGIFSNDHPEKTDLKGQKAVLYSEEALTKVAEAKTAAEDAAAAAAAAVKNSEDLWSQLAKQQDSGLTLEAKAKLASAAVAITAAASVTKAAAAAAKVAYHAALQAKLMADEAFLSSETSSIPARDKCSTDLCDVRNAVRASILKGDNITSQSNSILVAAKEGSKRRVETAAAASKQAENLDAVVKAAELAATAVSQAGKIVAMGEPLPLGDLLKAGPEGYWRLTQPPCELAEKTFDKNKEEGGTEGPDASAKVRDDLVENRGLKSLIHRKIHSSQRFRDTLDGHENVIDDIRGSCQNVERDLSNEKGVEVSDSSKCSALGSESEAAPSTGGSIWDEHEAAAILQDGSIKEGSLVEVFKREHGAKSAWYSAKVLNLKDGNAFVCYSDLLSEKGSGNLCEWVTLNCEGDKAPLIRAAQPLTALQSHGTRKRRRAALGDYAWSIGDRVDVWINDCWWEGVVTEKNEKDETTLKVHFPVQGEMSTVRAWNLRTSRLWTGGKWIEWSPSGGRNTSEQSETPQEKRQKMGSPTIANKEKDKSALDVEYASGRPEESKLALSTGDRVFHIGKTTNDDKRATHKPLRSGQKKEGSRVIFGVPKPTGKKRKFMEVSKHFPNRTDKSNETNDSLKFAKYLMPQTATGRGWKAPGRNESKERRTIASRSRAPSSRKPTRTLPQTDELTSMTAQDGDKVMDHGNDIDNPISDDENKPQKKAEHGFPTCEETSEAPLSSLLTTSRKISLSNAKSERPNKGKLVPAAGKMSRIEEEKVLDGDSGKSVPEVTEPRRSNRRIQPTHRLLEGLQSSMVIPKLSSLSHDKGLRGHNRNVSTKGKLL